MIRRVALFWVCCALALAGCSKAKQPSTLPPLPSASPSPSASPTPPKPTDAKASVTALARTYFAESNVAIRTGDTKALRALSVKGCPCDEFANFVDAEWKRGTVPVPEYYTVTKVDTPVLRGPTVGLVSVVYRTNRYRVVDKSGHVIVDLPPAPEESATVECRQIAGVWKVADVVRN